MPTFALPLPNLPTLPSLPSLATLPSLHTLSNIIDPGPSVFYPATKAGSRADGGVGQARSQRDRKGTLTGTPDRAGAAGSSSSSAHPVAFRGVPASEPSGVDEGLRGEGDWKRARGRTISMPHSVSYQYPGPAGSTGTSAYGNGDTGTGTIRERRMRGTSITSTRDLHGRSGDQGSEWKIVDNPLARVMDKRGGSTASLVSVSSRCEAAFALNGAEEQDGTPRPHRLMVDIEAIGPRSHAQAHTHLRPPSAQQYSDVMSSRSTEPRHLHQPYQGGLSGNTPTGRKRPLHRRAISALPTPTATVAEATHHLPCEHDCLGIRRPVFGSLPSPARPTTRRSKSINSTPGGSGLPDTCVAGRGQHDAFSAGGFAFPALPARGTPDARPSAGRLLDNVRNVSVVSLPTLAEGEHSSDDHSPARSNSAVRTVDQSSNARTRRGSLSIALPQCHTRTFSQGSAPSNGVNYSHNLGSPKLPIGLYRATSNVSTFSSSSNESDTRRPMSPLSMSSTLGSSLDLEFLDPGGQVPAKAQRARQVMRSRSERQSFSVPPPAPAVPAFAPGQAALPPLMSPRGYSTGDVCKMAERDRKKRTRTYSSTSMSSSGTVDLIPVKGAVEEPSTSDVAVITTWTFAAGGHDGEGRMVDGKVVAERQGGLGVSMTLKERLASHSRLYTVCTVAEGCKESSPGDISGKDVQVERAGWRMPLQIGSPGRIGTTGAPLIRVTSLADHHRSADRAAPRAQRPAYLNHRHTHSSPTLQLPSQAFPRHLPGATVTSRAEHAVMDDSRPITRKRQLSKLREPSRLGATHESRNREEDNIHRVPVVHRGPDAAALQHPSNGKTADSMNAMPSQIATAHQQEPSPKKRRWWHRRNSIAGVIPSQPVIRPSYLKKERDMVDVGEQRMGQATASLSSLDLASPAGPERRTRQESPESEEFIDFDDM